MYSPPIRVGGFYCLDVRFWMLDIRNDAHPSFPATRSALALLMVATEKRGWACLFSKFNI